MKTERAFVDIRGVNTHNKGAQLMLMAITARLGPQYGLAMSPNGADYSSRARLGLWQTVLLNQAPLTTRVAGNWLPSKMQDAFGLVSEHRIGAVLDAAGFAYSDSFSAERSKRETRNFLRWKARGVPTIMLPQAFGPFRKSEQRMWSRRLLATADAVYARDKQSLTHVKELDDSIAVELYPDFTIGLKPDGIERQIEGDYAAIVPNAKMVTHSDMTTEEYFSALVETVRVLDGRGLRSVAVVHEFSDLDLAKSLSDAVGVQVYSHRDPLVLKRVLADARLTVASRFHALVSSLASGTPALALGWSHKYEELMEDFGVPGWLAREGDELAAKSLELLDDSNVIGELAQRVTILKTRNEHMWDAVERRLSKAELRLGG